MKNKTDLFIYTVIFFGGIIAGILLNQIIFRKKIADNAYLQSVAQCEQNIASSQEEFIKNANEFFETNNENGVYVKNYCNFCIENPEKQPEGVEDITAIDVYTDLK